MNFSAKTRDQPFCVSLSTNAPHGPHYVDKKYAKPYRHLVENSIFRAEFYGMITNIDENFGQLEAFLAEADLADNTILIFMTDNGSGGGMTRDGKLGHNHGFSGKKGSKLEGEHRVPFFIRWKDGNIQGGRDIDSLSAHVNLRPTLASLCGLTAPKDIALDGIDLAAELRGQAEGNTDRTVFVHHNQDWRPPLNIDQTAFANRNWRLVNGTELYDIAKDRLQQKNLAAQHPDIVDTLLAQNNAFVTAAKLNRGYFEFPPSILGNPHQPEVTLTIQHTIGDDAGF
jgi:arylsulfatase A-like enzyme